VTLDERYNGWHPDPFGRFDERYIVYGEPSRLVRHDGVEQTDRQPLTFETPAGPAVEHRDSSTRAHIEGQGPDPISSSHRRVRSARPRAIAVVVLVLTCALIATVVVSRRNAHPKRTSAGSRLPRTQPIATIPLPHGRIPRSPQRRAVPSPATSGHGQVVHTSEASRTAITQWTNQLLGDMNNVNEVVYNYGHGTLEQTACQRTWNDAAKVPTATMGPEITAAAKAASHDITAFASACAHTPGCTSDRAPCGRTTFAEAYRRSVRDLNALQADLSNG